MAVRKQYEEDLNWCDKVARFIIGQMKFKYLHTDKEELAVEDYGIDAKLYDTNGNIRIGLELEMSLQTKTRYFPFHAIRYLVHKVDKYSDHKTYPYPTLYVMINDRLNMAFVTNFDDIDKSNRQLAPTSKGDQEFYVVPIGKHKFKAVPLNDFSEWLERYTIKWWKDRAK